MSAELIHLLQDFSKSTIKHVYSAPRELANLGVCASLDPPRRTSKYVPSAVFPTGSTLITDFLSSPSRYLAPRAFPFGSQALPPWTSSQTSSSDGRLQIHRYILSNVCHGPYDGHELDAKKSREYSIFNKFTIGH